MEAEFNFNNKILEIKLMQCSERGGNFPKEQYDIRKEKSYYTLCQQKTDLQPDALTTET